MIKNDLHQYENKLINQGYQYIAGVDEAGRGALCGPVVAASVIFPLGFNIDGINDSKKLTPKQRSHFREIIINNCLDYSISIVDSSTIDKINILEASRLAMNNCIKQLKVKPDFVLTDAMKIEFTEHISIIKGDQKSISIAAASIIAKTTRDEYMEKLALDYPEYGFDRHFGYGTKIHLTAINELGIIEEHRKTFSPVSNYLTKRTTTIK